MSVSSLGDVSDSAELNMRLHASCDCATKSEPSLTYGACPLSQALVYVSATRRKLCCRKSPSCHICDRLGFSFLGFFNFPSFWSCSCLVSYFWVPVSAFALSGSHELPIFPGFLPFPPCAFAYLNRYLFCAMEGTVGYQHTSASILLHSQQ